MRRLRQGKAATSNMLLRQMTSLTQQLCIRESGNQRRRRNKWEMLRDKHLRQPREVGESECRNPLAK